MDKTLKRPSKQKSPHHDENRSKLKAISSPKTQPEQYHQHIEDYEIPPKRGDTS